MTLFEPPPHDPTVFTPRDVAQRIGFDLVLGCALGVGAACAFFAGSWAGVGHNDIEEGHLVLWIALAIGLCDALFTFALSALVKRKPQSAVLRSAYSRMRVIVAVLLVGVFAVLIGRRLSHVLNRDFETLVVLAAALGVTWLIGLRPAWREARSRVTPWLVAALSLYMASDWAVKLGRGMEQFQDPRVNIAYFAMIGCGVYVMCAVLAAMDWVIAWRNRDSEATKHG